MRAIALLVALLSIGCGRFGFQEKPSGDGGVDDDAVYPVVAPPPPATDGSRLRSVEVVSDDVRLHIGWHDTALRVDCRFRDDGTGTLRCLPTQTSYGYDFADAGCTTRVATAAAETLACGSDTLFASPAGADGPIYRLGPEYTGAVYQSATTCQPRGSGGVAVRFWSLGAEEPMATFVAAHEELTRSGAYSHVELVADDGARERQGVLVDHRAGAGALHIRSMKSTRSATTKVASSSRVAASRIPRARKRSSSEARAPTRS